MLGYFGLDLPKKGSGLVENTLTSVQTRTAAGGVAPVSDTLYSSISFRKSIPPQNRQLNVPISDSKQQVDDFVGDLTF